MRIRTRTRRGYAMLAVLAFVILFVSLLGVAYRQTASSLRLEKARSAQAVRDAGAVHALARAMALLETGRPPSDPCIRGVTLETPAGPRAYTVTFTSLGDDNWRVGVAPTGDGVAPAPLPTIFLP